MGVVGELPDLGRERAEPHVLLGFVGPRRAPERRVHREAHVVDAEPRVAVPRRARGAAAGVLGRDHAPRRVHRRHVGLVHAAVDQPQRDTPVDVVGEEPPLARGDDPREARVPLVGHEEAAQRDLRGADVLDVDRHAAERRVEHALLEPAHRPRAEDREELALELAVGDRVDRQRERRRREGDDDRGEEHGPEQAEQAHAGGLERDDLAVAREAAAGQQDRDEERHRQRVGEEGREHEHEELDDEVEGHPLRDHEVGEVIDPVDDEEEGEERSTEQEGRHELAQDVAIEHEELHGSVVP